MRLQASLLLVFATLSSGQTIDWPKVNEELLHHYQALIRIDTTDPPGNETKAAEYVQHALEAEGIPVTLAAKDPTRSNLIARLKGNGSKRPLLLMGHLDTVQVDVSKWTIPPFSAEIKDGYIYGRGTEDNKWQVAAGLMTMLLLKRNNVALDRDVIFAAEAGEEAATGPGIEHLVNDHWAEIDAEACIAESGGVVRSNGQVRYALVETAEKLPKGARLVAHGPSGHGSRPMRTSAILHLSTAIEKVAMWDPPMRFNDTTRTYFEKLATIGTPAEAARYNGLFSPVKAAASREYLAEHDPSKYSMLHTSISPDIISGGFQINVIPSQAEATLDIRALPDEDMSAFYALMRKVINDPAIDLIPESKNQRPAAPPSRIDSDIYHAIEASNRKIYQIPTVPTMSTGASDMAFLRAKGMQCYGVGPIVDEEDAPKGFAAHSDQERLREDALYKFMEFQWDVLSTVAMSKK